MPSDDHKPDEVSDRDESRRETGEFTRAFEGKSDSSEEDVSAPTARSITQMLGKSNASASTPTDRLDQPRSVPPPPRSSSVESFTRAFDGVNALTLDPAGLKRYSLDSELAKGIPLNVTPSHSSVSFTRLFGSGEGILTPSGDDENSRTAAARDRESPDASRPREVQPSGFTEAFESPSAAAQPESKTHPRSFTEEFEAAPSWQRSGSLPASTSPSTFPTKPENAEPVLHANLKRPAPAAQGFEHLVGSSTPVSAPSTGATIVFGRSGSPEQEITEPQAESDYTMVRRLSDLRSRKDASGIAGPPAGGGGSAAPAWTPSPAPAPPQWQPTPQPLAPPVMPQAPPFAAPAVAQRPPSLGDRLVSFLPFMLGLTVINFLGLLAGLIILFATRK